jgi:glycerol kinase
VPALNGLFSPYWRVDARGLMIGISSNTSRGHIVRSLLESPCLRTREVVDSMQKDSEYPIKRMSVDGGMTVNSLLLQVQAYYTKIKIVRNREKEVIGI